MYRKYPQGWTKHIDFFILDLLSFQLAFLAAYWIRNGIRNPYSLPLYREIGIVGSLIAFAVAFSINTYRDVLRRGMYLEFRATLKQVVFTIVWIVFYLAAFKNAGEASRFVLLVTGAFYLVISFLTRTFWKKIVFRLSNTVHKRAMVIITTSDRIGVMADNITQNNYLGFRLKGICVADADTDQKDHEGIPLIPRTELLDFVCHEWVDEVMIDSSLPKDEIHSLTEKFNLMGVVVHRKLAKDEETIGRKQFVESMGGYTVLTTSINYATTFQLVLKRAMDIAGGIVGCIGMLLVSIVLVPMIKCKDPGPAFFSQTRVGRNGRRFKVYKFRSMYMDAEERKKELMSRNNLDSDLMFKMENDPRIIGSRLLPDGTYQKGLGNRIRDWSIDEFPQFWNVLKGDMSLVGTRPPTVDEWDKYKLHHRARLAIKPGITGMWQVSGRSSVKDFEDVVKLDTYYINNWNFGLDIKILLQTVKVVLGKDGSM